MWQKGKGAGKKGKGKPTKSAGKGKARPAGSWATTTTNGTRYCWKYARGTPCDGKCGEVHRCPVIKTNGWVCGGKHTASECNSY